MTYFFVAPLKKKSVWSTTCGSATPNARSFCSKLVVLKSITNLKLGVLKYQKSQVIMMRLKSDLLNTLIMASEGRFSEMKPLEWDPRTALLVVMASNGYPGSYEKKTPIKNLKEAAAISANVQIFHAGTAMEGEQLVAIGGRVLGVTAIGDDVLAAQTLAYKAVDMVQWPLGFCRRDIGYRAVERLQGK